MRPSETTGHNLLGSGWLAGQRKVALTLNHTETLRLPVHRDSIQVAAAGKIGSLGVLGKEAHPLLTFTHTYPPWSD